MLIGFWQFRLSENQDPRVDSLPVCGLSGNLRMTLSYRTPDGFYHSLFRILWWELHIRRSGESTLQEMRQWHFWTAAKENRRWWIRIPCVLNSTPDIYLAQHRPGHWYIVLCSYTKTNISRNCKTPSPIASINQDASQNLQILLVDCIKSRNCSAVDINYCNSLIHVSTAPTTHR